MSNDHSVTRLVQQLGSSSDGDTQKAAREIWKRYLPAILELAKKRLSPQVRRREDEEDVAQSMFKSFCARQQRGEFNIKDRNDLWRLLITIVVNKARNVANHHRRGKRSIGREHVDADDRAPAANLLPDQDPTPADAAVLVEELEQRLSVLPADLRQIAQWKLEGFSNEEIAGPERLDCAIRTVERKLMAIRKLWSDISA